MAAAHSPAAPHGGILRGRAARWCALALTALCLSACRQHRSIPEEDVEFAKRYLTLFSARSLPAIEMGMDPTMRDPQTRLRLMQMASVFPAGEPHAIHLVGAHVATAGDTRTTNLALQYDYPQRYVLADLVIERRAGAPVVRGIQVTPLRESLDVTNRATFAGKGPAHYAAVAIAAAVLAFVLYVFVLALRTDIPGARLPWLAGVLVGVSQFAFNWTTGSLSIALLGIHVAGSDFSKASPFAPLVISTSIPVGAIVFLIQRREWLRARGGLGRPRPPWRGPSGPRWFRPRRDAGNGGPTADVFQPVAPRRPVLSDRVAVAEPEPDDGDASDRYRGRVHERGGSGLSDGERR